MSSSLFSSKPSLVRAQKRKPRDHDRWVPIRRPALRLSILRAVSNYFLLMRQENNFTRSTGMAARWRHLLSAKVSGSRAVPVGDPGSAGYRDRMFRNGSSPNGCKSRERSQARPKPSDTSPATWQNASLRTELHGWESTSRYRRASSYKDRKLEITRDLLYWIGHV